MTFKTIHKELFSIGAGLITLGIAASVLAAEVTTVAQKDRRFDTASVEIGVGGVIRFTNEDPFFHQLYTKSPSFAFSSEEQPQGEILSVPFPVAGTFEIRCEIHPKMLLTVNVQ